MSKKLVCNAFEKPFPHLIVDNFYDDNEIELIWEELKFYTKPNKLLEAKDFGGVVGAVDLDQVIRLCLYSVVATFVLSLFLPYHVAMEWIVVGSILLSIILIVVSYLSWRYYNPAARSYFFAWTLALIGKNLTNALVVTSANDIPFAGGTGTGTNTGVLADMSAFVENPREIILELSLKF